MTESRAYFFGEPNVSPGGFMFINVLPNCSGLAVLDGWTLLQCHICKE